MLLAKEIDAALPLVHRFAARTELRPLQRFSARAGVSVLGKLELQQPGGSYKIRGAAYALCTRTEQERARGVITFSTGNFGRAVALVARELAMPCVVYVSPLVPENKLDALRTVGADVQVVGTSQDDAEAEAARVARQTGAIFLSPLTDPGVYCGHGTIGTELSEQLQLHSAATGTVVVPMSGGGLLAGVAVSCRARLPGFRLVGASMRRGAAMFASLLAGRPVQVPEEPTLADSLGGGVGGPDSPSVPFARALLDEACVVSEEEIFDAIRACAIDENLVCEGAAAVPLAAVTRFARRQCWPEPVVVLLTGQNIDPAVHREIVEDGALRAIVRERDAADRWSLRATPDHWTRASHHESERAPADKGAA